MMNSRKIYKEHYMRHLSGYEMLASIIPLVVNGGSTNLDLPRSFFIESIANKHHVSRGPEVGNFRMLQQDCASATLD